MKNKIITLAIVISLILFLNLSSADIGTNGVQFFQFKTLLNDSITTRNFASVHYSTSSFDTITSGKQYESYVYYHTYVDRWNSANPTATVNYCSLKVIYSNSQNTLTTLTNSNFTTSIDDAKYFVRLSPNEAYYVYADCVFKNSTARNNSVLSMPMEISIVEPTYMCQACQYYNWVTDETQLNRAVVLSDYTTTNVTYIKKLMNIIYEILIYSFWILMIILLLLTVGLIFYGIYWFYLYLQNIARKI